MARPSAVASMTIAQLEQILVSRHNRLKDLARERDRVQKLLDKIDTEIGRLSGRSSNGAAMNGHSRRGRNGMSLVATLEGVLANGKPLGVGEIVEAVQT